MKVFPTLVSEEAADYAGRVRVLSPEVAHRIPAGEVIERPAAVRVRYQDLSGTVQEAEAGGLGAGVGIPGIDRGRAVGRSTTIWWNHSPA